MDQQAPDSRQQHQAASTQQQYQLSFRLNHQQFAPIHRPPLLAPCPMKLPQLHLLASRPLLLHLQLGKKSSLAFPPNKSQLAPSLLFSPYDSPPPPPNTPPSDPVLRNPSDKIIEYAAKFCPALVAALVCKVLQNYPIYSPPDPMMNPSPLTRPYNASNAFAAMLGPSHLHLPSFPTVYDQHHFQPFGQVDYDHSYGSFKGLSRSLPSDVEMQLNSIMNNLTKESIEGAKIWFMPGYLFVPTLSEAFKDKVFSIDDSERLLPTGVLFDSFQRRINPPEVDNEALAFNPVLEPMLARIYHNPQIKEENQSWLGKILKFWGTKEVYDQDTIRALENEMIGGRAANFLVPPKEFIMADTSAAAGFMHQAANQGAFQCKTDQQSLANLADPSQQVLPIPSVEPQQFLPVIVLH